MAADFSTFGSSLYNDYLKQKQDSIYYGALQLARDSTTMCQAVTDSLKNKVLRTTTNSTVYELNAKTVTPTVSRITLLTPDSTETVTKQAVVINTIGASVSFRQDELYGTDIDVLQTDMMRMRTMNALKEMAKAVDQNVINVLDTYKSQYLPEAAGVSGFTFGSSVLSITDAAQKEFYLESIHNIMTASGYDKPCMYLVHANALNNTTYAKTYGEQNSRDLNQFSNESRIYKSTNMLSNIGGGVRATGYAITEGAVGIMPNLDPLFFMTPDVPTGNEKGTFHYMSSTPMPYINDFVMVLEQRNIFDDSTKVFLARKYTYFYNYAIVLDNYIQTAASEVNNIVKFALATT